MFSPHLTFCVPCSPHTTQLQGPPTPYNLSPVTFHIIPQSSEPRSAQTIALNFKGPNACTSCPPQLPKIQVAINLNHTTDGTHSLPEPFSDRPLTSGCKVQRGGSLSPHPSWVSTFISHVPSPFPNCELQPRPQTAPAPAPGFAQCSPVITTFPVVLQHYFPICSEL